MNTIQQRTHFLTKHKQFSYTHDSQYPTSSYILEVQEASRRACARGLTVVANSFSI